MNMVASPDTLLRQMHFFWPTVVWEIERMPNGYTVIRDEDGLMPAYHHGLTAADAIGKAHFAAMCDMPIEPPSPHLRLVEEAKQRM